MYKIVNGILEKNNKKVFAVGESYYPSFHPAKYPVPPEGDRMGEMKKDFAMMKDMGFNHIRIAAIGITKLSDDGRLIIDTPFVDAMIDEAEKADISISIRLHGFSVNLRDFKDVLMVDNEGNVQDTSVWLDFIQSTMCHEGILEDNCTYSAAFSSYYAKKDNVVGFQIYNEPHFPGKTFFDYHPVTVNAYRKWLAEHGVMTKEEVADYYPPKTRNEQSPEMWAMWRIFSRDCLTNFLNTAAAASNEASNVPSYTCFTPCQLFTSSPYRGVDIFANARSCMDIVGYTCYYHAVGAEYYSMGLFLDMTACAAACENKETWCIELDSRTYIPPEIFNKNTYAAIGSGVKGILYYQWRGDYPSEATPIPNGCGLLNYDGSKTKNFENADKMVKFINKMSDYIVNAIRANEKIAVFHSDYATFMCDAIENTTELRGESNISNSYQLHYKDIYTDLRMKNYCVNILDAAALKNNDMQTDTLFVPRRDLLSAEEKEAIEEFIKNGGRAFESCAPIADVNVVRGYLPYGDEVGVYTTYYTIDEICREFIDKPAVVSDNPLVAVQRLEGDFYNLIVLTNIACTNNKQSVRLSCGMDINEAVLYTPDETTVLKICNNEIIVETLADGAIIVVK